jgi:2-(1,2-epoxy-1,2-dihydrophenyl)acetyl-CoA isomerase
MGTLVYSHVRFERRGYVAVATLNRPEVLNALNWALREDILALAEHVRAEDDIRALVITGEGRGFCSGADLSGGDPGPHPEQSQNDRLDELEGAGRRAVSLYAIDKPVIGAINGVAAGAGMSLALSCDLRVGGPDTRFRTMFTERSLSPDSGMSYFLPRIVGYARAADLILTSRDVDANEGYRLGLLDRLVTDNGEVVDAAVALAQEIARKPPLAVRSSKRVLQHNVDTVFGEALRYETAGLNYAKRASEDGAESAASFREKRAPIYQGK